MINRGAGEYSFSDWSFGAYSQCYGGVGSDWGSLTIQDSCEVVSFSGLVDSFGDTWTFNNSRIDGEIWSFDWENTYGESGSTAITFPGGVPFRLKESSTGSD